MAGITSGVETCPFCKKPFKRLKSHLPHCKMAGDADSRNVLPPSKKAGKKKEQIKSTETTSKKENKKNKAKATTHSLQPQEIPGSARCSHQHSVEDAQKQIKCATEKTHKTEGANQGVSEDVRTQSAEKVFSATKLAKKSPTEQKSRSKPTPNEEESASSLTLKPLNQNGKSTSESPSGPSQTTNPSMKQRQRKESSAKPDSFTNNYQPIPQRFIDTVELVIENHRVRILRNKCVSSVENIPLNKAVVGNQKAGCWPAKPPSGDAEIALADGQQSVTEPEDGKSSSGLELSGNIWSGETKKNVTTIKAHTSDGRFMDNCRQVSNTPVHLAAGIKSTVEENPVCFQGEGYWKESPVYISFKSEIYPSFTGALQERHNETSNYYLTSLGKEIALRSVVTIGDKGTGIYVNQSSLQTLEMPTAHWSTPPDRSIRPSPLGLEWFPELYPNYRGLGLFSKRPSQWATIIPEAKVLSLPWEGQQAWNGYYNRYISVKKNGVAGISILLLGCVLSYAWSYPHISKAFSLYLS
uniref:ATP synthase membrane subunit f n=1 Tax=Podarcis muralis TaxID=64176 RepID=A0A670HLU9_PODMU